MYSLLIYNFYYDFLELILKKLSLFDMIKNEVIKVDSQTMDLIKLEENKIRSFDTALQKICGPYS